MVSFFIVGNPFVMVYSQRMFSVLTDLPVRTTSDSTCWLPTDPRSSRAQRSHHLGVRSLVDGTHTLHAKVRTDRKVQGVVTANWR